MSVGFVMLAHEALDRAGQVALHLARQGAPVVIHVDRQTDDSQVERLADAVSGMPDIWFADRVRSDWGTWRLVEATIGAARLLLARKPDLSHVYLISGSCLPIRPLSDLQTFLDANPRTDFIESVAIEDVSWAIDGLEKERFTLTFPFSWRRQRRLFDAWVELQRRLRVRRKPLPGLTPNMGAQWWCLTTETLRAILADPDYQRIADWFRHVWIPDESFFQTMARRHSRELSSRSLTYARFAYRGRPHQFYDDHLPLLLSSDAFFARKIWPGARELYGHFLGPAMGRLASEQTVRVDHRLAQSGDRRAEGRPGLVTPGRFPKRWADTVPTAAPYTVLHGFDAVYDGLGDWLTEHASDTVHGRLFHPDGAQFAHGGDVFSGGLPAAAPLRDYDPGAFLRNLIWATRGHRQVFFYGAGDTPEVPRLLARDPHAEVWVVTGAWLLDLDDSDPAIMRAAAARLQRAEAAALALYRERWTRARVRSWSLADVIANPAQPLHAVLEQRLGDAAPGVTAMPPLRVTSHVLKRIEALRDAGVTPHLAGDVAAALALRDDRRRSRSKA